MQGKKGRFELNNFATEGPEILTTAAAAGIRGVEGAKTIGALAQIGMMGNGSPAETSTSLRNMIFDVAANADKIQSGAKFGKKVKVYNDWDEKKGMRSDFDNLLIESISATRGSLGDMGEVFKRRGIKTPLTLMKTYQDAYQGTKGSDKEKDVAATAAVKSQVDYFKNLPADFSTVEQDSADAMKSFAVQMEIINTKLKDAIASELFPIIVKMVPQIAALIPQLAKLVQGFVQLSGWLLDNPLKGLGAALAISVAYEFAKAQIASIISSGLTNVFNGLQTGGMKGGLSAIIPTSGAGQSVGSAFGNALGPGLAIGATVGSAILGTGIAKFEVGENSMNVGGQALNAVRSAGVNDIDAVKEAISEQRKRVRSANTMDYADNFLDTFGASNKAVEAKTQESYLTEMMTRLAQLQTEAAEQQKKAAVDLTTAAGTLNGAKPNDGDKPSPIKNPK